MTLISGEFGTLEAEVHQGPYPLASVSLGPTLGPALILTQ
jgi:hypothetical protein